MILLMDDSSVSEPFLPRSGTSMNSSIISTSLLHHQAEFGSQLMVSIHLFRGRQFGQMALFGLKCSYNIHTGECYSIIYWPAHPESTKKILSTRKMKRATALANTEEDN